MIWDRLGHQRNDEEILVYRSLSTGTDCPEFMESPSLEILQSYQDAILCYVLRDDPA